MNARAFPVSDEQDILGSGGKAGYRLDVRSGRIRGNTEETGNGDDGEAHWESCSEEVEEQRRCPLSL
jgi:hypothetical protein